MPGKANHYLSFIPILAALLAIHSAPSLAKTIQVTKKTDSQDGICDSDCSLREAISYVNKTPGFHHIYLETGVYTITITTPRDTEENEVGVEDDNVSGDIDVWGKVTIHGSSDGQTLIDAQQLDRHFTVAFGGDLTLKKLTLVNGKNLMGGGSIMNLSKLTIEDCHFHHNTSEAFYHAAAGGAISNSQKLQIKRSEFSDNLALGINGHNAKGGAIINTGELFIRDTIFRRNQTQTANQNSYGGAIHNEYHADIGRSLFEGNSAETSGMAIYNQRDLTLANATISGNKGNGNVTNGALHNTGTLSLIHTSIVHNTLGSGIYNIGDGSIRNSIILNNLENDSADENGIPGNCLNIGAGQLKIRGLLLGGGNTRCAGEIHIQDSATYTHVLMPLAANNSALATHALLPFSPALDASIGSCSSYDQRSQPRPVDSNNDGIANCDLGSYEHQTSN